MLSPLFLYPRVPFASKNVPIPNDSISGDILSHLLMYCQSSSLIYKHTNQNSAICISICIRISNFLMRRSLKFYEHLTITFLSYLRLSWQQNGVVHAMAMKSRENKVSGRPRKWAGGLKQSKS